ncbi:MAG: hypothetical protein V3T83_12365 [Acidobacteriota bacterium]
MRHRESGKRKAVTGNRHNGMKGKVRRAGLSPLSKSSGIPEPSAGFGPPLSGLRKRELNAGFVLASSILIILLLGTLMALVHMLVRAQWRNVLQVESQLHSRVLAENGIEYARALLPRLELESLLQGLDGGWCGGGSEWRNPLPLDEARRIDPDTFQPSCDDGLPHLNGAPLPPSRLDGGGGFWIRYSNNPEEDPQSDLDGVIVVRSLGVAPSRAPHPSFPSATNSVSLLEVRLRQETSFLLRHPLTVFADSALFVWEGEDFRVEGGEQAAFGGVSQSSRLFQDLLASLTPSQSLRLQGAGLTPSLRDIRLDWLASTAQRRFFSIRFWESLTRNLPLFNQGLEGNLAWLENPGPVALDFEGILFCRGDLELSGSSRISGLLVHLGGGRLTLRDNAQVEGAVWLSNLQSGAGGSGLEAGAVSFKMARRASIRYDEEAVRTAIAALPPTQLGWRIVFPETIP